MKQIIFLLDNIRSIYNVGSFFRTADGAGISKLYLCGITATPEHPKVAKTALGATYFVTWEYAKDSLDTVRNLKKNGYTIYSIELGQDAEYYDKVLYPDKTVLVFGHEVDGVNPEILKISDKCVMIPMRGKKESLNVATSCGIVAYESTKNI